MEADNMSFGWAQLADTALKVATKVGEAAWQRNSANHAYRQSVNSAKHAHQWEVEDLRNAGLNPILSAGGNGAAAQAFMTAPTTADISLLPGAQADLAEASAKLADANIDKVRAETTDHLANAALKIQERDESLQRIRNLVQDLDWKKVQAWLGVGEALKIAPQIAQFGSTRQMQLAQAGMFGELAKKARSEGLISDQQLKAILSDPEAYKKKIFGLDPGVRTVDFYGSDTVDKVRGYRQRKKEEVRSKHRSGNFYNPSRPSGGGYHGAW